MKTLTIETVKKSILSKGYKWFDDLNIVGVRSKDMTPNSFNDVIFIQWKDKTGKEYSKEYKCTTEPGLYYLNTPINVKGSSILVPGQYVNCWKIGMHQGKYEALVQIRPITVYRDNNKDSVFDFDPKSIDKGIFGVNIHRANAGIMSIFVDKWSAGCQVIANPKSFDEFLKICKDSFQGEFTYTLLEENDIK